MRFCLVLQRNLLRVYPPRGQRALNETGIGGLDRNGLDAHVVLYPNRAGSRLDLGIGAGAHSFLDVQWGSRWEVPSSLSAYQQALNDMQEPMSCLETFNRESALSETVYLALRTRNRISDAALQKRSR